MSFRERQSWLATSLLAAAVCLSAGKPALGFAHKPEEEIPRKIKIRVAPVYPDLARRLNLSGVVRLAVVVAPMETLRARRRWAGIPCW